MRTHPGLIAKTLVVTAGVVIAFFAGIRPAEAALIAGAVLLPSRRLKVQRIYHEIDWSLLLMFAGLFVVVAALEHSVLTPAMVARIGRLALGRMPVLAAVTAVLSNLVSNVPAVLVLRPFVATLHDPARAWRVVAMAATFSGNFSVIGSVANLIVAQRARAEGVTITLADFMRAGVPLAVLSLLVGLVLL